VEMMLLVYAKCRKYETREHGSLRIRTRSRLRFLMHW